MVARAKALPASLTSFSTLDPGRYMTDIVPGLVPDPTAKVAVMRKGGHVKLNDYSANGQAVNNVTFGLAWDVTKGVEIGE